MNVTEELTRFVTNNNYENLTQESLLEAKKCFLDGIAVILAGSNHKAVRILREHVTQVGGEPQATIFGANTIKSSVVNSALINGTMSHIIDFDDTHRILGGHPTAVILPVVLALGEFTKASGKEILTAFVLGIEISCKIARGVNPYHYSSGYHVTSTVGIFGATVAAAKLLKLGDNELLYALGIAGSMSAGLKENFGTMTKPLHVGLAASHGITAAMLAQKGYTASKKILEGDMGFCNVLSRECQCDDIIKNLGNPWEIEDPGITRKKYPCCARTHSAIDGVLKIVNAKDVRYEDLEEIECATDRSAFKVLIHPNPRSELEAKFSMPFCLAIAFLEKDVFINHFSPAKTSDPVVVNVMKKVSHIPDDEIDAKGYENRLTAKVKLRLVNGIEFHEMVGEPEGDPRNPLPYEEIVQKFCRCAEGIIKERKTGAIIESISNLDYRENILDLIDDLV